MKTNMNLRNAQRGAILVTSLLLLLVVTIIGVSVMQMTRMQERMAGNSRDLNLAFQGAEAALRGGETRVLAFAAAPATCSSTGAVCATVYAKNVLPALNAKDKTYWTANAQTFTDPNLGSELKDPPQYMIEQLAFVPYTAEFGELSGRDFYQTSARSAGGTGGAESVVQTTFARTAQ